VEALWQHHRDSSLADLNTKSISDILSSSKVFKLRHSDFQPVDAEDSVYKMCRLLQRQGADYVPIIDPDEGNLVAVLGYLDVVNLLDTAARQFPHLFVTTIEEARVGTYRVITAPHTALLSDVLRVLDERHISSIPITNDASKVVGLYYKSDVSFITKSPTPDAILLNLATLKVGEVMQNQIPKPTNPRSPVGLSVGGDSDTPDISPQSLASSSSATAAAADPSGGGGGPTFCTCQIYDTIKDVLACMMANRSSRVVIVDDDFRCLGIVSIRDIVMYYIGDTPV